MNLMSKMELAAATVPLFSPATIMRKKAVRLCQATARFPNANNACALWRVFFEQLEDHANPDRMLVMRSPGKQPHARCPTRWRRCWMRSSCRTGVSNSSIVFVTALPTRLTARPTTTSGRTPSAALPQELVVSRRWFRLWFAAAAQEAFKCLRPGCSVVLRAFFGTLSLE